MTTTTEFQRTIRALQIATGLLALYGAGMVYAWVTQ